MRRVIIALYIVIASPVFARDTGYDSGGEDSRRIDQLEREQHRERQAERQRRLDDWGKRSLRHFHHDGDDD
jgi:hypothetical protein